MKLITVLVVVAIFTSYVVDTTSANLQIRKKRFLNVLIPNMWGLWGLGGNFSSTEETEPPVVAEPTVAEPSVAEPTVAAISGPLSSDFSQWLKMHQSYSNWRAKFERNDLGKFGSYGGKTNSSQQIKRNPIIFIHGNSDQALDAGRGPVLTGWTHSIHYFLSKGYTSAELYATTWGPANAAAMAAQTHSCAYLTVLRKFTEAVITYTGASKINIIAHSMGVTLARKVVRGGTHRDSSYVRCDLGDPLTNTVDTFIGIAGGNKGLLSCAHPATVIFGSCSSTDGFSPKYPSYCPWLLGIVCSHLSKYLEELNSKERMEGKHIYTIWSTKDKALKMANFNLKWETEPIPGQDGQYVSYSLGHIQCKDNTGDLQYDMVTNHRVPQN